MSWAVHASSWSTPIPVQGWGGPKASRAGEHGGCASPHPRLVGALSWGKRSKGKGLGEWNAKLPPLSRQWA